MRSWFSVLSVAALSAFAISPPVPTSAAAAMEGGVDATWERAEIWVKPPSGGFFSSHMDDRRLHARLGEDGKLPTVIFFDDCGANRKMAGWHYARFLARAGFAVILPDSFARQGRPITCEHWQLTPLPGAPVSEVHALRLEEIGHALARARALPWVDTDNLFLMGHGEGGDALAAFPSDGVRARVLSATRCPFGIHAPEDTAMLFVASEHDRLFAGKPADACVGEAGGRRFEMTLFPGYQHDTSSLSAARDAVTAFLIRQLAK